MKSEPGEGPGPLSLLPPLIAMAHQITIQNQKTKSGEFENARRRY